MAGLRFESLADMPEGMRKLAADKIAAGSVKEQTAEEFLVKKMNLPKTHKYHNVKTQVAGIRFDSKKEARRYEYLCRCAQLGVIEDLRLQVDFTLIEAYTDAHGVRHQALRYKADFTYKVRSAGYDHLTKLGYEDVEFWRSLWPGALVIEDVKSAGTKTRVYINKKKMMADKGYQIREV